MRHQSVLMRAFSFSWMTRFACTSASDEISEQFTQYIGINKPYLSASPTPQQRYLQRRRQRRATAQV